MSNITNFKRLKRYGGGDIYFTVYHYEILVGKIKVTVNISESGCLTISYIDDIGHTSYITLHNMNHNVLTAIKKANRMIKDFNVTDTEFGSYEQFCNDVSSGFYGDEYERHNRGL